MLRPCIGCGALIATGSRCPSCQPTRMVGRPWRRRREQVFALKGRTCIYCGAPATDVDHLTPVIDNGGDSLDNLAPACLKCNRGRGQF
jgi:5-methylcytosine-specific restriction endonuclease McrA